MAAEVQRICDSGGSLRSPGGMAVLSRARRSCSTPTMGWGIRFNSFVMRRSSRERGGRVIVQCQQAIAGLLASCPGVEQVVVEGSPLPEFAVYAPLMSLPMIFGTTLSRFLLAYPISQPMPSSFSEWLALLGPPGAFKIGVAWQGNPRHRRDRERSFRLSKLGDRRQDTRSRTVLTPRNLWARAAQRRRGSVP